MTIAKVTEVICASPESFDDAIKNGLKRAKKTIKNIKSAWVKDQEIIIEDDKVTAYRVTLKLTFVLKD